MVAAALAIGACGESPSRERDRPSTRLELSIELSIEREIGTRIGAAIRARCKALPPGCVALLPDGTRLPIALRLVDGELAWAVDGLVVVVDALEAYLRDTVAELGAPQGVRCGARVHRLAAGARVECALQLGGRAFIVVHGDGSTSVEIDLDPVAGAARSESTSIVRDRELVEMSLKLEHAEEAADD